MLVAMTYLFHDHEPVVFLIDTNKLDVNHKFEATLRVALESDEKYITLDGNQFTWDNGIGIPEQATVNKWPATINAVKIVSVDFENF